MVIISWSYSGDPSTSNKDAVRFAVGDTDSTDELLRDEEINFIISNVSNVTLAAAVAADRIASIFSRRADRSIGDFREASSQQAEAYLRLAERLRQEATGSKTPVPLVSPFAGGISISDKRSRENDTDRVKPAFRKGETDFPGANRDDEDIDNNDVN